FYMDKRYLEELIRSIQSMARCPNCGSHYRTNMISIIGGAGHTFLVHLECLNCGVPALATVIFKQQEIKNEDGGFWQEKSFAYQDYSFEPFVDNKFLEKFLDEKFKDNKGKELENKSPVTVDDVLETHRFLKNFNGDFEKIFKN
ncbi:MAG: hypothetical protein ACPLYC_01225, partial [Minisyncoccia bacterium]